MIEPRKIDVRSYGTPSFLLILLHLERLLVCDLSNVRTWHRGVEGLEASYRAERVLPRKAVYEG